MIRRVQCAGMTQSDGDRGQRPAGPVLLLALVFWSAPAAGIASEPSREAGKSDPDPSAIDFFEKQVRPILVDRCQGCHGPTKQKGGLRLDSRQGLEAGGSTGPVVMPGMPEKSLLIDAVNYGELYQMPPKSKLPADEIATLTRWVKQGPSGESTRTRKAMLPPR